MSQTGLFWWASRRDWRQRDVRLLLAALVVAVATVATISLFADHLRQAIMTSATQFLAADRQLTDAHPLPQGNIERAQEAGLETASMTSFSTMLFGGDGMELVQVKAVSDGYPLLGELEVQDGGTDERITIAEGPETGEIWVNPRVLRLLDIELGAEVEIGDARFEVTRILLREPDGGFNMAALAPRVMIHESDVAATGVVQPGSRVTFTQLFSGEDSALEAFHDWLEPRMEPSQRWRSVRDGQPAIADALDRAERFLLLGGSLAVLLAAVAVAVSSRQYALGQRDNVALFKTLGMGSREVARLYLGRLALWGGLGSVVGILLALPVFVALAEATNRFLDESVPWRIAPTALIPALATALVALFAFAWPPIQRLRGVSAMQVLRSEPGEAGSAVRLDLGIALVGLFGLLWFYGRELWLVVALLAGVAALLAIMAVLSWVVVLLLRQVRGGNRAWRLALVSLYRHRRSGLSQMSVFAMTLMLAATLFLVRTALLDDWQQQLPEDAPNHFLINIAPEQVEDVENFLAERNLESTALYPMVRGRLVTINDQPVSEAITKEEEINALNRELNLTWLEELPEDNRLEAGDWWREGDTEGVSVEAELFEQLELSLGDELGFRIGDRDLRATVRNVRSVQWDSMRPNFYMAFSPGTLEDFPATWITSFHLESERKDILNELARSFPTVSILEVDHFIERIRSIISQVTVAIETLLVMILIAAILVMAAVISATLGARQREGALLRTLGTNRGLLVGSSMLEFAIMGLIAGFLGVLAAELVVWSLQYRMFEGQFRLHPDVWLLFPLLSAALLAVFGRWQLRPVLNVSPMILLRRLEG